MSEETPVTEDFWDGVRREKEYQVKLWGVDHDQGKTPADWFWTLGYLGGKALASHLAGDRTKALHHTITAAALLSHWHDAIKEAK